MPRIPLQSLANGTVFQSVSVPGAPAPLLAPYPDVDVVITQHGNGTGLDVYAQETGANLLCTPGQPIVTGTSGEFPGFLDAQDVATYGADAQLLGQTVILAVPALPGVTVPVDSVNSKTGAVVLVAGDVGAVPVSEVGAASGVAALDGTGKVPASQSQVPSVNGHTGAVTLAAADVGAIPAAEAGAANGVAQLDGTSKVPVTQLPTGLMSAGAAAKGQEPLGDGAGNYVWVGPTYTNVTGPGYGVDNTGTTVDDTSNKKIQNALNAIAAATEVPVFPPGLYKVDYPVTVPANGAIKGAHRNQTFIQITVDPGTGVAAITTEVDPSGNSLQYPNVMDLTLISPWSGSYAPGVSPLNGRGIDAQSDSIIERVNVIGFAAGITFAGNHQKARDCRVINNNYGLYWLNASTAGNQRVEAIEIASSMFAGIAVHGDEIIDSSMLTDIEIYQAPYGVYKEHNGSSSHDFISDSTLELWMESIGNAAIYDQIYADTGSGKRISYARFPNFSSWWDTTGSKISTRDANYAINVGQLQNCEFEADVNVWNSGAGPSHELPGALGVFNVGNAYNVKLRRDGLASQGSSVIGSWLECMSGGKLLFNDTADVQGVEIDTLYGGRCSVRKVVGASVPVLGDLLYLATASGQMAVAKDLTSGSNVPVGLLQAWGVGTVGHWAPVLVRGRGPYQANAGSNLGNNAAIAADTAGVRGNVVAGALPGTAANPIIGYGRGVSTTKADVFVTLGG